MILDYYKNRNEKTQKIKKLNLKLEAIFHYF